MNSSLITELRKMINLVKNQTYKIVKHILNNKTFTQKEIQKKTKVSKGRISQVVSWLQGKKYVVRLKKRYELRAPVALVKLMGIQHSIEQIDSFEVNISREKLLSALKKKKVVFCLTSALEYYSKYFRDPSINFYTADSRLVAELKRLEPGLTRINIFKPAPNLKNDTKNIKGIKITDEIRTVIDLFCTEKAYAAERLIGRLFG